MLRTPSSLIAGILLSVLALSACQEPKLQKINITKGGRPMTSNQVEVRLNIEIVYGDVYAQLQFINNSTDPVFIEKRNGCLNSVVENNVFEITSDSTKIEYIGIYEKLAAPTPENFVKLVPAGTLGTRVRLNDAYEFLPGSHTYKIVYSALHPFPSKPGFISLESNEVDFTCTK